MKFRSNTASLVELWSTQASNLPSCDQENDDNCGDLKLVSCVGGPPVTRCSQMLDAPLAVIVHANDCPSGVHRNKRAPTVDGNGNFLGVSLSSNDRTATPQPMTLRAPLGDVTIRRADIPQSGGGPLASVSAANYNGELASEAIAAAFGSELALETVVATSLPLPTTLAGVTVRVRDSDGVERDAPLFFVSPSQINYLVPAGTSNGVARVSVVRGLIVASGEVAVNATAPGLFSANANGRGVAAAYVLRVRADLQIVEPVVRFDQAENRYVPVPIDLGPDTDQVFLVLYGTGLRGRSSLEEVNLTIGGESAEVQYLGTAREYFGLDQVNVLLPRTLAGKGEASIMLTVENRSANIVTAIFR